MKCKQKFYPETRFGGFSDGDGTVTFYIRVNALLDPSHVILDFGCGRGSFIDDSAFIRGLRNMKGKVAKVIGLDIDPSVRKNPFIDEFHLLDRDSFVWPVDAATTDLILSDWVLEHIEKPNSFFEEAYRVLKPGGRLCIRTSNRWSYVSVLSRLIPSRFHHKILSKIQPYRKDEDVFPTHYACNTLLEIKKALRKSGFDGVVYGNVSQPSYLEFSCFIYGLGVMLHKITPQIFAHTVYVFAEKPS